MSNKELTFEDAKNRAVIAAKENIEWVGLEVSPPYLSEFYLENDVCWMFFRREDIIFPPQSLVNHAYVFSRKGEGRLISNYRDDLERAKEYLGEISDYFVKNNL